MEWTVADSIASALRAHQVEVVFGLPGGESVPLIAALEQAGIRFVLARHEAHAAWMADGYSRIGRRPAVCFIGDGGMGMVVAELETAVRLKLPIVVVVLADEALSLIRLKQELAGYPPTGTLLGPTDWCQVARGFGARGMAARSVAGLKAAIMAGLQADGPTLIEASIDASEYQSY